MENSKSIKNELLPLLHQAEKLRRKQRFYKIGGNLFILTFVLGLFFLPAVTYFNNVWMTEIFRDSSGATLQVFLILYWALYFVFMTKANRIGITYKQLEMDVLQPILDNITPGLKFSPQKQITSEAITKSELIPTYTQAPGTKNKQQKVYNMSTGLAAGKVGDTSIVMGDVKIINQSFFGSYFMYIPFLVHLHVAYNYLRPWFSKNHSIDQTGYSFMGMYAIIDFNKKINGSTIVLPDKLEKKIGYLAKIVQSLKLNRKQLINLEHPEFENEFVVYGTDQVEARYILSTAFMERITFLKRKMDRPIMLSFHGDKLYMAIQHPDGFFSLPQGKDLIRSNAFESFAENISNVLGIVEDLNLNSKIWKG
ncbi:Protein of unknown function [Flagellimonas taeanensis]|uniref:DUF3137 domain-containing protein n=1 Tax=Flagellimonas taeanensis TaxID=1005926 RepID=A0A1M6RGL1_9FLAO|nr:DUF3137 domain-containing protein [Allomuricauda taeanensis]SFB75387.1 Protein of unknown function [Allomuricauda taeanensis]SHK31621.1 Protein of unknown function [Allomuricauda taeanensis]